MSSLLEQLQVVLRPKCADQILDETLLEQFVTERDSTAFAELVRRHGPMVFGVCRRILRHHQDAEDAFQAVFLVLAHKASSVYPRENLSSWLHGVACRTALKARCRIRKRQSTEVAIGEPRALVCDDLVEQAEWHRVLDEEMARLPEVLRLPILLCGLQGKTRQAAARELGCPEGTIAGRFYRAKQMLAERLAKRGFTLSLATLTCWFSTPSTQAMVPVALLASTTKIAELLAFEALANAMVPKAVQTLSEGVMSTMSISKWKTLAVSICFLAMSLGVSYVGFAFASGEADAPNPPKSPPSVRADREPITPELVLEKEVQKELRLSPNQINKLKSAWEAGKAEAKNDDARTKALDKQIEALRKQIETLQQQRTTLADKVHESQQHSLKSAIFAHLSNRAIDRLRQLSLRRMSMRDLLMSPKMQAKLNINDEQLKKLQELASTGYWAYSDLNILTVANDEHREALFLDWSVALPARINVRGTHVYDQKQVLEILTPEQRKKWESMLGEPYPRPKK